MDPNNILTPDAGAVAAADHAMVKAGIDPDQARFVERWHNRYEQARVHDKDARDRYDVDRKYARGETDWLVDTNLLGAILEILASFTYAKDPDFEVKVGESVGNSRAARLGDVTETLRISVSKLLRRAGLKAKCKRLVRSAQTVGAGWLKPALITKQVRLNDTIIQGQINSLRENLLAVATLEQNIADDEVPDQGAAKAELEAKIKALEAKLERTVAEGFALDFFAPDDVQVAPDCGELCNYLDASWIAYRTYKSKDEAQGITGWPAEKLRGANIYTQRVRAGNGNDTTSTTNSRQNEWIRVTDAHAEAPEGFVCFIEIWSKVDGMVYTMIDGIKTCWAKEPFAPLTGSRFYDGFLLGFHWIDGERHPQSDVQQLRKLQDEYGRTRSNFAVARRRNIPKTVWDAGAMPTDEVKKINDAEAFENVAVNFLEPGQMQQRYVRLGGDSLDPALYDTRAITTDMEKVSGAQDAMQSGVSVEKTATEAQIQNTGFGARIGSRRDELEEVLAELALWTAQVSLQALGSDIIVRLAGEDAVWPKLTVDEVMEAFEIEVKAGSTGKPNRQADQAAWGIVLPLIEKMAAAIGNFRTKGMEWAAEPYIAMLKRTLQLHDMVDDIEKYLPKPPPVDPLAQALAGAAAGGDPDAAGGPTGPMQASMENIGTPAGSAPAIASPPT